MRTCLTLMVGILCCFALSSQVSQNVNWLMGNDGIILDFDSGSPVAVDVSVDVADNIEAGVFSDNDGDVILMCNGDNIYNGAGDIILDGELATTSNENVFTPHPTDPNLAYLFRSGAGLGTTYTLIDISTDTYSIVEGMKDVALNAFQSQILISSEEFGIGQWVLLVHNENGNFNLIIESFLLDESSIESVSEFSAQYSFAGWFNYIDEARISPDCETIVTSHKGHYLSVYSLDRVTGEIDQSFDSSLDLPDSFSESSLNFAEFSASGQYLYVLRDNEALTRFQIGSFDVNNFTSTQEELFDDFGTQWSHIKRGINGNIYLYDENNQELDAIENADAENLEDVQISQSVLEVGVNADYFPNTAVLCSAVGIAVSNTCLPDPTFFQSFGAADSLYWEVELADGSTQQFDEANFDLLYEEEGNFDVTFHYQIEGIWYVIDDEFETVLTPDAIDLGEDVFLCAGEVANFDLGDTPYPILWSTGDTIPTLSVDEPAIIDVTVTNAFCQVADTVEVSVQQAPPEILNDINLCADALPLELDVDNPFTDTYAWSNGDTTPDTQITENGTYWVDMVNNCFEVRDSITVVFDELPVLDLGADVTLCDGETASWDIGNEDFEISWSDGSSASTYETTEPQVVSVTVVNGLCTVSDAANVDVLYAPNTTLEDIVNCDDATPTVLNAANSNTDNYLWQDGSEESSLTVDESGVYTVIMSNDCFTVENSASVAYVFLPTDLLPDSVFGCGDFPVTLAVEEEGNLQWTTGETGSTIVNTTDSQIGVTLEIQGCTTDDESEIIRYPYPDVSTLLYPNVITLNGDSINDRWRPFLPTGGNNNVCNAGQVDLNIQIFNRWGTELFEGKCDWNGIKEASEKEVTRGCYWYIVDVTATCLDRSNSASKAGYFEVISPEE